MITSDESTNDCFCEKYDAIDNWWKEYYQYVERRIRSKGTNGASTGDDSGLGGVGSAAEAEDAALGDEDDGDEDNGDEDDDEGMTKGGALPSSDIEVGSGVQIYLGNETENEMIFALNKTQPYSNYTFDVGKLPQNIFEKIGKI